MNHTAPKENKVIIAYHANCIDGFTSAWIVDKVWRSLNSPVIVHMPMRYDAASLLALELMLANDNYTALEVVDYSLPLIYISKIADRYKNLFIEILDHHKTTFEKYFPDLVIEENTRIYDKVQGARVRLENDECGASLCWKHFYGNVSAPRLIEYVKDYDLWQFNLGNETKWVNQYLRDIDMNLKNWDDVSVKLDNPAGRMEVLTRGHQLFDEHNHAVADLVLSAKDSYLNGIKGLAVECHPKYSNDVGTLLVQRSGTFGATYYPDHAEGVIKWSLRSNNESSIDVSVIAKNFGGGGHRNAAGFDIQLCGEE